MKNLKEAHSEKYILDMIKINKLSKSSSDTQSIIIKKNLDLESLFVNDRITCCLKDHLLQLVEQSFSFKTCRKIY